MSLTITIPGAVNVTTGAMAPAVLTIGVGVPGAQGPQGPAGPGVPAGGTAGQFLQKIDGVNYNTDWVTLNLSGYAPLASPAFTGNPTGPTAALGDNDTSLATTAFVQQELLSGTANAKNLEVYVRNQTGSTLAAGAIVYINGATGNRPTVTLAQANNDANSAQTFGFVKASIANNGFGYVIVRGECENLDTSAVAEGTQLYLSPTVAGAYTTTKPSAPQHLVYVGIVVRSHPTQGVILVAVQNGYELDELHDVALASETNNDLLVYESSSDLWKNKSIGTLGLATQSYVTSGFAPIAAGLPVSGTVGQVLTKNSGTNYDASWATLIPGDRYLTTSTSSVTIGLGSKSLTVGTGLSYSGQQDVVISYDASNHMHALVTSYNSGTGALVVNVQSVTGSGTYSAWTVNVGGTTPLQSVEWGEILGTLGDQTDLATALNAKLETSTAASTYAPLAGATFTGLVSTPASATGSAGLRIVPGVNPTSPVNGDIWTTTTDLQVRLNGTTETIAEQSWVTANFYPLSTNPSGYLTSSALTPYALLSGATFTGLVGTVASTTTSAGFNVPHGTAPTSPVNGDIWTTTGNLWVRINGASQAVALQGNSAQLSSNNIFTNASSTYGNSTAAGTINLGTGATISGATKVVNIGTGGAAGSTTTITVGHTSGTTVTVNGATTFTHATQNIGTSTTTGTTSIAAGAMASGNTKTVNVGTGSLAGSTTNVTIGSSAGTSTTTLQGTTNGVTVAADTNSTALATTAYVVGQAGSATPLVNGTAAVGTSLRYARQDHVHPTDTTRAPLASPAFTGTPSLPTGTTAVTQTAGNNTTAIATTAFVTAAVPAAATHIQSLQFSSTSAYTRVIDSSSQLIAPSVLKVWPSPSNYNGTSTSGAGASALLYLTGYILTSPSAGVAGNARAYHGNTSGDLAGMMWGGSTNTQINFSRRVSMAFRFSQFPSSTASVTRVLLGKIHGTAVGDLTSRGIGVKYVPNGANFDFQLQVHDGTTLTSVTSSTQYAGGVADLEVVSDGSGNAVLYLNGNQVASTTGAPTGNTSNNATVFAEVESTASTTNQPSAIIGRLTVNSLNF